LHFVICTSFDAEAMTRLLEQEVGEDAIDGEVCGAAGTVAAVYQVL
jgi:hypothetical protein